MQRDPVFLAEQACPAEESELIQSEKDHDDPADPRDQIPLFFQKCTRRRSSKPENKERGTDAQSKKQNVEKQTDSSAFLRVIFCSIAAGCTLRAQPSGKISQV